MCTITNYRFIINALGSAYINDYEKYTTEVFYLLIYMSAINFHYRCIISQFWRDLKKMLLLINCCNKRGNHAISQNWRYFRSRIVFFYTLLNQCNTTEKHNHTHTKKRYLAVISHSKRFKEFNRKKTATKTSNQF
jgi:hypothetical protein